MIDPSNLDCWIKQHFGLQGDWHALAGEKDFSFRFRSEAGKLFVVKCLEQRPELGLFLDFQFNLLSRLKQEGFAFSSGQDLAIPAWIQDQAGAAYQELHAGDQAYVGYVLSWVEGTPLRDLPHRPMQLFVEWGQVCGRLSQALADFDHSGARLANSWNLRQYQECRLWLAQHLDGQNSSDALRLFDRVDQALQPLVQELPLQVCYADAHEDNLLFCVDQEYEARLCGLIDVGDATYTWRIAELAIACAYAAMDSADPLGVCRRMLQGYLIENTLQEVELKALFPAIQARLLMSLAHSSKARSLRPDHAYAQKSEAQVWALLRHLEHIDFEQAEAFFRHEAGFEAASKASAFRKYLAGNIQFHPVIDLRERYCQPLDLRVGSTDLGHYDHYQNSEALGKRIHELLSRDGRANLGWGGHGETRPLYTSDLFAEAGHAGPRWRSVHLGLDLWSPAGEGVYAPISGHVHSLSYQAALLDYGAVIILEHEARLSESESFSFWTLYGHLSADSLEKLEEGQFIEAGTCFARTGIPAENGSWPPHLHFQVILDLWGRVGDFPGVCFPEEQEIWMSNCPDPATISGLGLAPGPSPRLADQADFDFQTKTTRSGRASVQSLIQRRASLLGRSLSLSYRKAQPLHIVRGQAAWLLDVHGQRYLDLVNNVAHVGHEHPLVVEALSRQSAVLNTNTRYLHEELLLLAEELIARTPAPLSVLHFVNSGSEANELALRMAKAATGRTGVLVQEMGYHGHTIAALELSSYKFDRKGGEGLAAHVHKLPLPDTYRGLYRDPALAGLQYAAHVDVGVKALEARGFAPAAFLSESILSCGGQVVLPKGYLQAAYAKTRAAGGLCIADEVQTGLGRVGSKFWSFELQGVVPDIVTIGKPLGNGHPVAAVMCTPEVADAFAATGMEYFNTFGGNPVSAAVARAVLRVIDEEDLQSKAVALGETWKKEMAWHAAQHDWLGDWRGEGLFLGLDIVRDADPDQPDPAWAGYLVKRLLAAGALASTDGPHDNVLKIKPPMCIGDDLSKFCEVISACRRP